MVKATTTLTSGKKTYSYRQYYYRRKKNLLSTYFMDTIELFSTIYVPPGGNYAGQFVFQGLDNTEGVSVSVGGILVSDAGSRDIAKLFGLVRVNAVSMIANPCFHNQISGTNLFSGDVVVVYYNSREYRQLTYEGAIQQGKNCMHLNPFTLGTKYISLKGSTKDYIAYSAIDADQNNTNIPGYFMIYSSYNPGADDANKCPKWGFTIKLYCTFKK